jgi:hypothetical protein
LQLTALRRELEATRRAAAEETARAARASEHSRQLQVALEASKEELQLVGKGRWVTTRAAGGVSLVHMGLTHIGLAAVHQRKPCGALGMLRFGSGAC